MGATAWRSDVLTVNMRNDFRSAACAVSTLLPLIGARLSKSAACWPWATASTHNLQSRWLEASARSVEMLTVGQGRVRMWSSVMVEGGGYAGVRGGDGGGVGGGDSGG